MTKFALNAGPQVVAAPATAHDGVPSSLPLRPELVQKHLEKLLESDEMRRSKKLCQFLRFTVDEVLHGHGSELKEYAIAVGVFRRGREFDPGADPIVRVQARRLRSKLQHYYQTDGRDEPIRIEYPVGSYSPVITRRMPLLDGARSASNATAISPAKQLAVLPFVPLGGKDCCRFSEGLAEELIHVLSSCSSARVVARASSFQFKDLSIDIRTIGERLGASLVIAGSVRLESGRVRVLAQLVDTESGINVWSGVYERDIDGVLAAQESISNEIAGVLQCHLTSVAPRAANAAAG